MQRKLRALLGGEAGAASSHAKEAKAPVAYPLRPIGTLQSVFSQRNGTPRQPLLVPLARARLKLRWRKTAPSAQTVTTLDKVLFRAPWPKRELRDCVKELMTALDGLYAPQ